MFSNRIFWEKVEKLDLTNLTADPQFLTLNLFSTTVTLFMASQS